VSGARSFQIVMPSLNQGRYIGVAIRSVLRQSADVPVELVIVDACSTDETEAAIDSALGESHSARVTLIREPDDGQSDAIAKGMARGSGEIVSWLNADDALAPSALARVDRFFQHAGPDVVAVYGDIEYIDSSGERVGSFRGLPARHADLLWGPGYIPQPSTFARRAAWDAVGGVRKELHYAMDFDLWLRLSECGRVEYMPETLASFRLHSAQKTTSATAAFNAEAEVVRREHARRVLGRDPSQLEVMARKTAVRASRKLRLAARRARGVAGGPGAHRGGAPID
jgi:glycosyltransferase involved in cell wall biosynthesis